ncbi:MAG: extracellular solute-binding protein [Chloroflexi bacterium]|nr:extracellular solute-binding protein [Chloroflexota bacterium]
MSLKCILPFVILSCALAACDSAPVTPTPPPPTPTATATPETVTLQLWTVLPDKGISEKNLTELTQAFQAEYPLITIKIVGQPTYTDLFRKVVASIAAGTLPELVTGLDSDITRYARLKALAPLDSYMADPVNGLGKAELSDIPAGMMESTRLPDQDNKMFSLPFARGALALYYNWSAMKAIGITNTPKTWDEFKLHAKALTKNPVRGLTYRSDAGTFAAMLVSRGASLYSADRTKSAFNALPGVDTLNFLTEGVRDGWIVRAEGDSDLSDFLVGRTIFNIASTAAIPVYQATITESAKRGGKDFDWGITLLPQVDPKKPAALMVGANIAITKSTGAKQQAAWLFLRWLMGSRVAAQWTQAAGVLPARLSSRDALTDFYAKSSQQRQAIEEIMLVARPEPNIASAPEIHELIEAALAASDSGRTGPKAALDDAAAKANTLLAEKK